MTTDIQEIQAELEYFAYEIAVHNSPQEMVVGFYHKVEMGPGRGDC